MAVLEQQKPPANPDKSLVLQIVLAALTLLAIWLASKELTFDYKDKDRTIRLEYKE